MVNTNGEIQDLLTTLNDDPMYVEGANDFEEWTVIENNDITLLNDNEAVYNGILSVLKTTEGVIDGVTLERFGSRLLSLRGQNLDWHLTELAKMYIEEDVMRQLQGYVTDINVIEITTPHPTTSERYSMKIFMSVSTIFGGPYERVIYI